MKKKSKKRLYLYKNKRKWFARGGIAADKCVECEGQTFYFYRYDSHCCPMCNIWLDCTCGDENCLFCVSRPEMPSMVYEFENYYFDKKSLFVRKYFHRLKRQNHRNLSSELQNTNEEKI